MPTIVIHTMISPILSDRSNCPELRNQINAADQMTIQTTPYQGLLIFFFMLPHS